MPLIMSCSEIEIIEVTSTVGFAGILHRRQYAGWKNCASRQSQCRDATGSFCWLMINEHSTIPRCCALDEHDAARWLSSRSEVHCNGRCVAEIPDIHAPHSRAWEIHGLGAIHGLKERVIERIGGVERGVVK